MERVGNDMTLTIAVLLVVFGINIYNSLYSSRNNSKEFSKVRLCVAMIGIALVLHLLFHQGVIH